MKILSLYEKAYGQAISLAKSKVFFSRNTPPNIKDEVTSILGVLRY